MLGSVSIAKLNPLSPRKQEILEVAQRLFSQAGYDGASMRQIAEALDIQTASLYSHYKSKDDMLWEIAIRCAREFHVHVLPFEKMDSSVEERLRGMVRKHTELIIENIDASAIFFYEWKHLEDREEEKKARKKHYQDLIQTYEQAFINVIEEGISKGDFRQVPVKFITYTLLNCINWIQHWYKPKGKMTVGEITDEFEAFIINALKSNIR